MHLIIECPWKCPEFLKGVLEVYRQNFGETELVFPKSRDSESHA